MLLLRLAAIAQAGPVLFDPAGPSLAEVQLPDVPGLYVRNDPERSWGSPLLVDTLLQVAKALAYELPDADPLFVGDLSRRGGGALSPHITHDQGLDVDIGLFTTAGTQPRFFADVAPDDLDLRATWLLIERFLDTGDVPFILLDQAHIDRLRGYLLEELEMSLDQVEAIFPRAGAALRGRRAIVRHAPNHRSHIHVRVAPPGVGSRP